MKKDPLCAKIFEKGVQVGTTTSDTFCVELLLLPSKNREQRGWKKEVIIA
jgi:hypothetical protein